MKIRPVGAEDKTKPRLTSRLHMNIPVIILHISLYTRPEDDSINVQNM
jgi:hypothetical protein